MKFIFIFLILISSAHAQIEAKFRPDYWSTGLHLFFGGGLNGVHYNSDDNITEIGYGINFKTDLGYYFTNRFAVEWSSNVKFNRVDNYLIWDTLMTFGIRYRMKEYYLRGFVGRAPTVVFFDGHPPEEFDDSRIERAQFNGPVYGLGVGKLFKAEKGYIWFLETALSLQNLKHREGIRMNGEVPEVISTDKDDATVTSLYFMIGVMLF